MEFRITINMDNKCFQSGPGDELAEILESLTRDIEGLYGNELTPGQKFPLMDSDGNEVGEAKVCE